MSVQDDVWTVKKGDRFTLECGHKGRVVWVSPDLETICVRGVSRHCAVCGRKSSGGWSPNNYLIHIGDLKEGDERELQE